MASTETSNNSPSRLLSLPPEIRNVIYRYTLVQGEIEFHPAHPAPARPALLQLNQQIRAEAIDIYYRENEFKWHIEDFNAAQLSLWCQSLLTRLDPPMRVMCHGKPVWKNLVTWLGAFRTGRTIGVAHEKDKVRDLPTIKTVALMFEVVNTHQELEWDKVLPILEAMREVAGAYDEEWLQDD